MTGPCGEQRQLIRVTAIALILLCSAICFAGEGSFAAETRTGSVPNRLPVDVLSLPSLYLELLSEGRTLESATGFIVEYEGKSFLITNWHVITGCDPERKRVLDTAGAVPDEILIMHHGRIDGTWKGKIEQLYDNGKPRWIEHPLGSKVDVIALPLKKVDDEVKVFPLDMALADTDLVPQVTASVFIIGFPHGLTGPGRLPIWKTGIISSEPAFAYRGEPIVLIDARTQEGMSGSPVIERTNTNILSKSGSFIAMSAYPFVLFLGVYSGRVDNQSDIGRVWRADVIKEILQKGQHSKVNYKSCFGAN